MSRATAAGREEIPPGTLELLILRALIRDGERHGFEIAGAIERASDDVLRVEEGSLYPALQRLLVKGWVKARWGHTREGRRARYYQLTPQGARQVEVEVGRFERVMAAVFRALGTT
jgi:transcriptional regulator